MFNIFCNTSPDSVSFRRLALSHVAIFGWGWKIASLNPEWQVTQIIFA